MFQGVAPAHQRAVSDTLREHKLYDATPVWDENNVLAFCASRDGRDFHGNMKRRFHVVTVDGRFIDKAYKTAGAITRWVRANRDTVAPAEETPERAPEAAPEAPAADGLDAEAEAADNGPVLTEEDRRTAYAARDKATRAHDRAVKRVTAVEDAVKRADECARSARESAELARGVADAAEAVHAAELSRLEATMWGHTPSTAEYRRAFGVWVAAGHEDAPEVEAADAAEVAADVAESEAESARETLVEARRVRDDLMHTFSEAFERAWGLLPLPEDCEYAARECVEFAKALGECVKEAEASAREAAWADSDADDERADAEDAHDYLCDVTADALFEAAEDLTGLGRTVIRLTAVQVQRGDLAAAVDVADVAPVAMISEGDDVAAPQGAEVPAGHAAAEGAAECAAADAPVDPAAPETVVLPGVGTVPAQFVTDAADGVSVPVITPKGDDAQVWFAGYAETCWGHCDRECWGAGCAGCQTYRPVMLADGMGAPYTWQDCAECMARKLDVPAAVIARAFTAVPGKINHAAAAYAMARHEEEEAERVAIALERRADRASWGEPARSWEAAEDKAEFGYVRDADELREAAEELRAAVGVCGADVVSRQDAARMGQESDGAGLAVPVDASHVMPEEPEEETPEEESAEDLAALLLDGMPANARKLYDMATGSGWDVTVCRIWSGRKWTRAVDVSGLVMVRAGVEEVEYRAAWWEDSKGYAGSVASHGYKVIKEAAQTSPVDRAGEESGRTVWGRDAAEWVRQMTDAAEKVSGTLAECRDAFNALDGSTPVGRRAVDIAAAAYSEAKTAERMAREAVDAAAAWMVETNAEDARGCAPWRRAVVLAGAQVKELRGHITGAVVRAEREALGAPVVEAGQAELEAEEAAWRKRCAAEGIEPTAAGYARVRQMFEDSTRGWVAWFAEHGDINASMVAQYDAWSESGDNERRTSYPSRYTCASLAASHRVAASALAYTLAVADHVTDEDLARGRDVYRHGPARVIERFRNEVKAVRRHPTGYNTVNERKHLAEWTRYPHDAYSNPAAYAEHAPAQWETYREAKETYEGVQILERSLKWEPRYAEERSSARAEAITAGTNGQAEARTAREASGQDAQAWAQAVERLTAARTRVAMAVAEARADVERAQECTERVTDADGPRAEDVWSAARFCEEAMDDVNRANREAAHYAKGAETYREAGRLADYIAECERMERAAGEAESAATEVRHLFECAAEDADKAEAARALKPAEPTVGISADSARAAEPGPVAAAFPAPAIPQQEPAPALESIGGGEPVGDPFDLLTGALAGLSARWDGVTGA
ncbi:hypothetical protein ACWDSL_06805 [Streptomyces sp. NPDC000941]